jgi:purine-nucleoside phosphorylase
MDKIKETVAYIQQKISGAPEVGIILGTGLGGLVNEIKIEASLPYTEIPNFPVSTVQGHGGNLIFGTLGGKKVVAMQGRFHFYEGYTMPELVFPVRVMKQLGINLLVVSNAAGGLDPQFRVGDIMLIRDHINIFPSNPLIGLNDDELGTRFPDMSDAYDADILAQAKKIAATLDIKVQTGVYTAVTGPNFETPAECRLVRILGADAVGMSTIPEVIAARHMGLKVFAVSIITDMAVDGTMEEISHEEVIKAANSAEPKMTRLLLELLKQV